MSVEKVTRVNIDGQLYSFVAGNVVTGRCGAQASDYIKTVVSQDGADIVPGVIVAVDFTNGNDAGFAGVRRVYSSDGVTFYSDPSLTNQITLPPIECYTMTHISGEEYDMTAYPVILAAGMSAAPICDSRGHSCGGQMWSAGDTIFFLYTGEKYIATLPPDFKEHINFSKSLIVSGDTKVFITSAGVTLELPFAGAEGSTLDIFAFYDCTITYYTDANTTASFSMLAGTSVKFILFNGWKFVGIYGAVWN